MGPRRLALWYKRLEEGTFKLPRIDGDAKSVELRASKLAMMLDSIDLRSGHFELIKHVRFKYACRHCQRNAENSQIEFADKLAQPIE